MKKKLLSAIEPPLSTWSSPSLDKMDVGKDVVEDDKKNIEMDKSEEAEGAEDGEGSGVIERCCGVGRVWIFLLLGILILVFSAVLVGIFMNVRSLTTSTDSMEVLPSFVPAAAGGIAGLLILLLVWKRHKVLVYSVLLLCSCTALLCAMAAVLTGTHVVQPLITASGCVYSHVDKICQCFTQFRRDNLQLERVESGDHAVLRVEGVLSCDDVQNVIPSLLFTMIGMYGVVSLVCIVAGVISLLVYRTEQRRKYLQHLEYGYEYGSPCDQPISDSHAEHETMLPAEPDSTSNAKTIVNIYTNPITSVSDDDNNMTNDGNTTPSDVLFSSQDVPMGYAEACRMRRCHSFSQPQRGTLRESSPGSSASSQTASLIGRDRSACGTGGTGKLKEHRRRGQRAVTLHGLDREQLLLILSLQMRYLQELDQSATRGGKSNKVCKVSHHKSGGGIANSSQDSSESSMLFSQLQRRAKTPTARQECLSSGRATDDLDYRPAKLVRSHTPQPYHFRSPPEHCLDLQSLSGANYHKHQPQPSLKGCIEDGDDEPPTVITYDLRNITKTGPVMYGRIPSSRSSSTEGSLSSKSSSFRYNFKASEQSKLAPVLYQTCTLPCPPSETMHCVKTVGGSMQEFDDSENQSIHQVSYLPNLESSLSEKKSLTPSKELGTFGAKGKKLSLSEKNLKKENESEVGDSKSIRQLVLGTSDLNSRGGAVTDRWQTLMEDGAKQGQTLWENVQTKTLAHQLTPDSTLNQGHPLVPEHSPLTAVGEGSCYNTSYVTKMMSEQCNSQNMASSKTAQPASSPYVIGGTMKISEPTVIYSSGGHLSDLSYKLPLIQNSNKSLEYTDKKHLNQHHTDYHNAFIPIAVSSTDTYDDIDEIFGLGQQADFDQDFARASMENERPERQVGRYESPSSDVYPPKNAEQSAGPQYHENATDGEAVFGNTFGSSILPKASGQYTSAGHHRTSHLQPKSSFRNDNSKYSVDRPEADASHPSFQHGRKASHHFSDAIGASDYNPSDVYRNQNQFDSGPDQFSKHKQYQLHHHHHHVLVPHQQRSAFHTLGRSSKFALPGQREQVSVTEICDTGLNQMPNPRWQVRALRSQSFSPPPYIPPPVYKSMETVHKHLHSRSGSTSSSEPLNTSCTSSELSSSSLVDHQSRLLERGGQDHGRNHNQAAVRSFQPAHVADRGFRISEKNPRQQRIYRQGSGRNESSYRSEDQPGGHRQPPLTMRRCQSMEEKHRIQMHPNIGSHGNTFRKQGKASGLCQNIDSLNHERTFLNGEQRLLNPGILISDNISSLNGNNAKISFSGGQPVFNSYTNPVGQKRPVCAELAFMPKGVSANQIAGYVGVVKLVDSSDSDGDHFAETVI